MRGSGLVRSRAGIDGGILAQGHREREEWTMISFFRRNLSSG